MDKLMACILGLPALFYAPALLAETFRCEGVIIEKGMHQNEVSEHCGPADSINTQNHNYWVYEKAAGHLDVYVYFYNNGDIEKIETAGH
jgi:hypothetical protein